MKYLSVIAVLLAAAALALTLNRELDGPKIVRPPSRQTQKANESNQALQDELLVLRMKIAALEKKIRVQNAEEAKPIPVLQEQVADLTTFQEDLAEYTLNMDPLDVIGTTEREIETAYSILMDESRPAGERARQAALLKRFDLFDQEAIDSMNNLFLTAEDPNEKAAALTALKGHVTPEVRDGVLQAFSLDIGNGYQNGRLRYHGIEALEPLLPNPEVEAMLIHLAQNDPEPKIAGRAAKSMGLSGAVKDTDANDVDSAKASTGRAARDG